MAIISDKNNKQVQMELAGKGVTDIMIIYMLCYKSQARSCFDNSSN